jgi:hypothetical protein
MSAPSYRIPFVNPATGERKVVTVTLSADEWADVEQNARRHGRLTHEPLARRYALDRALQSKPSGFTEQIDQIERVERKLH